MLTKVERNGLIGATGYYHILVIPQQRTNEVVIPNSFTFLFKSHIQCSYRIIIRSGPTLDERDQRPREHGRLPPARLVSIRNELVSYLKNPARYHSENVGLKLIEFYNRSDPVIDQCHRIGGG
jgi:hypothetical protein